MIKKTLVILGASCLLASCATSGAIEIPASLKTPCESTSDVSQAQTIGDLGSALIRADGDLALCSLKKQAVVEIAESRNGFRWPWQR